jgi:hypothetical protein
MGFNPYRNTVPNNRRPRSAFAAPKAVLSKWEAKRLVEKTRTLDEAAQTIADATEPAFNVALATRLLFKQIKRRRS